MTLSIVLSTALPLLTGALALLWAGWVAPERETLTDPPGASTENRIPNRARRFPG